MFDLLLEEDWLPEEDAALIYELTVEALNEDWPSVTEARPQVPPELEILPPGPLLAAALAEIDRSELDGYDLVRVLKASDRLVAHYQACSMATAVEISYAAPLYSPSPGQRHEEAFEFASDEIRAALTLTRNAADARLSLASELVEMLPRVWEMLHEGIIDFSRAMVIARGVLHLGEEEARNVVEAIAERAPRLTTGELAAWIRRLCAESEPERAKRRYEQARKERLLWIEQTVDGTGAIHILNAPIEQVRAIGRRVNAHMFALRKVDDPRTHDQMRADIATDLLLGSDPTNRGRGLVDIQVDLTTLAGLDDKVAEIPGLGPVIADVARKVADMQPKAEWRVVVTDDEGQVVDIVTTTRRPNAALSRYVEATQPVCAFPGCRMPARYSDFDHLVPRSEGGETSSENGGPKCRHDHILKDHGWTHERVDGDDRWTSPLGHTYTAERPP